MKNLQRSCINKKRRIILFLALLLAASAVMSISCGPVFIAPDTLADILTGRSADSPEARIVTLVRIPRTIGCVFTGMALAVSGAIIQEVLANPLAAPNIIGINAGAGMAITVCGAFFPASIFSPTAAAFLGAMLSVAAVLTIAEKMGASKLTLVLSGIVMSSMCNAVTDAVITFVPDALNGYTDFRVGGFYSVSMPRVTPAVCIIIPAMLAAMLLARDMDILILGRDIADSLGLNSRRFRLVMLSIAAILAGAAVSMAGLIGYVGLMIPHIMRKLVAEDSSTLLISSALGGGALVNICDLISRLAFSPYELPVGILLSLMGGPFFIALLFCQRGGRRNA